MRKGLVLIAFAIVLTFFSGCGTFEETPEARAKRLERRKAHIEQQKRAKISHLSGLSDAELEILQAVQRENSTSDSNSFIYSGGDITPDKRNYLNDLNEIDRKEFKRQEKSTRERRKSSSSFVFGL